jgi:hypothetical protein
MKTKYYQMHNFVRFSIQNNSNLFKKIIDSSKISFENYEVGSVLDDCDFKVKIGPFKSDHNGWKILDDNYHINKNFLFIRDNRKFSRWKIEICDLESLPIIKIETNTAGAIAKPLNIIEFFIFYKLLQYKCSTIHAAGLEKNGDVILLAGTSGGGKTTISLSSAEHGYNYLGDNYIILHNNMAYNYLTPLNIFYYNRVPLIEKTLTVKQKIDLFIRKGIYEITGGYIKIFKKINPIAVVGNRLKTHGPIKKLCFIEPNNDFNTETINITAVDIYEAAKKLRFNMELEWIQFFKYFYSYGYLVPDSPFSEFWDSYEDLLIKNIGNVKEFYCVGVPLLYSEASISKIISTILS